MKIEALFDANKNIHRTIEKVITYGVAQEQRLKSEITEYVVTESIEEQFESLLTKMQAAMDVGGSNEIGVWVSGFYGSGKSSFTKYLGLAFDDKVMIDGIPFRQHLQNRLKKSTTKALLNTVVQRFPAAVLMLDLASEQVAEATMAEVSSVLYYKVLQWAGYSRNLKVAALERKLKKDGRYDDFLAAFKEHSNGEEWSLYRNDDLIIDSLIPEIAHQMYPDLFQTPSSFSTEASEVIRFENDRVEEMLEIAREASGKEYIIFIIDEVGQYVGSRPNMILNLDGLAKNLKSIGNGKVWIVGTAQQTLTEDDPKASLNSPELYKLKDRFPIQIDLEANDIKEICYNRLLGKSPMGEEELTKRFEQHGQQLRHHTKLIDARMYGADFDSKDFVNLYPFLPAHFDILLHLLGALAKSTGGFGLRSAIKVIQDILVDRSEGVVPIADQEVGWLATTQTIYDSLERDIRQAFASLHRSVGKVKVRFPDSPLHQNISKTVCVLQILDNLPINTQNVAALMHTGVDMPSAFDEVKKAIEELISDAFVPFGEQDGQLRFFSEKLNDIEQERAKVPLRSIELKRVQNEAIKEVYSPLPSIQLHGSFSVPTGLKAQIPSGFPAVLAGERNTIQTVVELIDPTEYETTKSRLTDESRSNSSINTIFLFGRTSPEMDELTNEIHRSREIVSKYRNDPDQEVKEYCNGQADRAIRLMSELERLLSRSFSQGSFVFRGEVSAVDSLNAVLGDAARKHLSGVAAQVFDRYGEAPVRVGTDIAEKILRLTNLNSITSLLDPLALVKTEGGRPSIDVDHKAIVSIKDWIDRQGSVDGKRLTEHFADAPFGWSPDTLRYLVATMLIAGEIKLKVAGREVTVKGEHAIDALKSNNSFKSVGISLRGEKPGNEILARAAERLTLLSGEAVVPLEDEISKVTTKLLPQLQYAYGPLAEKLKSLNLPGSERLETLSKDIRDILFNDASDAPQMLGSADSTLFSLLNWAEELNRQLSQGLEDTLRTLVNHLAEIDKLPDSGSPGTLKAEVEDEFSQLKDRLKSPDFFKYHTEISAGLTQLQSKVRDTTIVMQGDQAGRIKAGEEDLRRVSEWNQLTQEEQNSLLTDLEKLSLETSQDLPGLRILMNQEYTIQTSLNDFKEKVRTLGQKRILERKEAAKDSADKKISRSLKSKGRFTALKELDELIDQLKRIRSEVEYSAEFEFTIEVSDIAAEGD
ncbi:MAG: BREX system P-loop protein BrxC [Candidatus Marinimicrobia bacterium]|nr:BREX system P-loop protein BrxC [Candidatus Neomarinimicrobiota bacterium]